MPYKKNYRKVKKRRVYRKKKVYRKKAFSSSQRMVPYGNPLIPNKMRNILTYTQTGSLQSTSGVVISHAFRANSIFDPDQSGTGHQPYGHDELQGLYANYRVLGAKIRVKFYNSTAVSGNPPCYCGVSLTQTNSIQSSLYTRLEESRGRYSGLLTPDLASVVNKYIPMSTKKMFAVKQVADNAELQAAFGANPTKQAYFNVWIQPADQGSTTVEDILFTVSIDYIVESFEPLRLLGS